MSDVNDKQINVMDESFDKYMMYSLESSQKYSMLMKQRIQQTINYFLGIFTALVGGGVVVLTTVKVESLKLSILTFDLAIMVGVGTLGSVAVRRGVALQ